MMSFVLALIIVVAAFTVIATLIMVVLDKKKEIAVIKAMGAKNGAVLRAFLYQGGFIGVVGAAAGLVLGYGVCKALMAYPLPLDPKVYFISRLPVAMHASDFVLVGVFAVVVCLLATVWPALHAAFLRPAEAFRGRTADPLAAERGGIFARQTGRTRALSSGALNGLLTGRRRPRRTRMSSSRRMRGQKQDR
jgi:lipoprotein-releasing system permease protein